MKKSFMLLIMLLLLVSAFGAHVGSAKAASLITYLDGRFVWNKGVVFIFEATGFRNKDVRNASIFAGSNFHDLSCTVNKEEGKIVCVAGGGLTEYAGQTGIIHLAGQIFYVIIPDRTLQELQEEIPLVCSEGTTMGADVLFLTGGGDTVTFFVPGTAETIGQNAGYWIDGFDLKEVLSIGDIYCGTLEF